MALTVVLVMSVSAVLATANFGELFFHDVGCIAFSLSCFGMIDTIGIQAMGPALRS